MKVKLIGEGFNAKKGSIVEALVTGYITKGHENGTGGDIIVDQNKGSFYEVELQEQEKQVELKNAFESFFGVKPSHLQITFQEIK